MRIIKEKKMKKKLISVLLTLAVAGTMLAGCGSSKADDTKSEADSSTEKKPGPHPASRIRKISQSEFVLIW